MYLERTLGRAVRASLAVARPNSRFQFLSVVLDFLFGCHTLRSACFLGGCAAIGNDPATPFIIPRWFAFSSDRQRISKEGAGSDFDKSRGGVKGGVPEASGGLNRWDRVRGTGRGGLGAGDWGLGQSQLLPVSEPISVSDNVSLSR